MSNNKKIVNLTPHDLNIITDAGIVTFPASGNIARVEQTLDKIGTINGIDLVKASWGEIINLPEEAIDTIYVVSAIVANAAVAKGRKDVVCPADFERNQQGQIIGAKALMFV